MNDALRTDFPQILRQLPWRMQAKITIDSSGCWLIDPPLDVGGYGRIFYEGKTWKAHRLIYTLLVEPVPLHFDLDHVCKTRNCVNTAHLDPVTRSENILRGDLSNRKTTHCPQGHELTGENTYLQNRSNGRVSRSCKECRRNANTRFFAVNLGYSADKKREQRQHERSK